ncbi:MAG: purine-binding chemotaxis protein CheW [Lachnospiraceae bacterium]|nr:purine-binding chemotaxis protein CheW [Lachnospiraceae bacterium]MBP3507204.1 purine-binding chemotaxis protein CheW [Lachnospiraceae bacterium]
MAELTHSDEIKQYIVTKLGNEQYGIDISYVDNIVRMQKITRVPKTQPYFMGVINLRGEIIPVMSMRSKLEMEEGEITNTTRIIIIRPEQNALLGLLVDEVREVVTLSEEDVEKVSYDNGWDDSNFFVTGVGKYKDTLISLININGIIDD